MCVQSPNRWRISFDMFVIGEGEEVNLEIMKLYEAMKPQNPTKQQFLREAAKIEGSLCSVLL